MELGKLLKTNLKICLYDKKFIISILVCLIMGFIIDMNSLSNKDIITLMEVYISVIGIFIFCDIPDLELKYGIHDILCLTRINKSFLFFVKIITRVFISIIVFSVAFIFLYSKYLLFCNKIMYFNYLYIFSIFASSELFLGAISLLFSSITNNSKIGIGIGFFSYWLFLEVIRDKLFFTPFAIYFNQQNKDLLLSKVLCLLIAIFLIVISNLILNLKNKTLLKEYTS